MEPFANQKPSTKDNRRVIVIVLAAASFGVWYFDLVPELAPVATGTLETDPANPEAEQDEILAMLNGAPIAEPTSEAFNPDAFGMDERPLEEQTADDPLLSMMRAESGSIEDAFPEFGGLSEPPVDSFSDSNIQQVEFQNSQPADIQFEPKPTVVPSDMAERLKMVDAWMAAGETLEAHAAMSRIYWKQPGLRAFVSDRLQQTATDIYANPEAHFAEPRMVEFGETLEGIAKEFHVPWGYLAQLNGVTPATLQAGRKLKVLKGPFGAVVDLQRKELTIHAHGWYVHHYKIDVLGDIAVGDYSIKSKSGPPEPTNDFAQTPGQSTTISLSSGIRIQGSGQVEAFDASAEAQRIILSDTDAGEAAALLGYDSSVAVRNR